MSKTKSARPPGPTRWPVVGNTFDWARDPCSFREELAERYGDVATYEVMGVEMHMVTNPDSIERVLVTDSDSFKRPDFSREHLGFILGEGLIMSEGEKHRSQRALIQPAFYPKRIEQLVSVMTDNAEAMAEKWSAGDTFDVELEMKNLMLQVLMESMFGTDVDYEGRNVGEAVKAIEGPTRPTKQPFTMLFPEWVPFPHRKRAREGMAVIESIIDENIAEAEQREPEGDDLQSLLMKGYLEEDNHMDREQLYDEMKTFLFAGHETTGMAVAFTWYLLSQHPRVEAKLHEEFDRVLGGASPTFEDLQELEYTEKVLKESLRLYPPAHELKRSPTEPVQIGDYSFETDDILTLPSWVLHRDETHYDDPETFRPERWTDDFERQLHDLAYFPFGAGPRGCIGRRFAMTEARLTLATLAQEYRLELVGDPGLEFWAGFVLTPKSSIEMRVRDRS